jgi:SAM-dependent methyltransferase
MSKFLKRLLPGPKLRGYIDLVDPNRVAGWAAYDGGIAPRLTITANGQIISEITPNIDRHDLKPLFSNNIRLGFDHRFATALTAETEIAVTDERGRHLSHSPYRYRIAQTSWIDTHKRVALAAHYLKGSGIEIGALHQPLPLPPKASVKYVDRLSRDDLRRHYPELKDYDLVEPDVICNGETLSEIADGSVSFVVANHFIEHTEDPIAALKTFLRVLKPDGIIFMAVPDKRGTFDRDRDMTPFSHLEKDHEAGPQGSRHQHFIEWARDVEKTSEAELANRVQALETSQYSIHFHVWDALGFLGFVSDAKTRHGLPLELCTVMADRAELIVVLRKTG